MLPITESPDFKRVGDTLDSGYYDVTLFSNPKASEIKGAAAMDQALENYLLTIPGERLFNIEFGSPLYQILFQKNVNQDEIRERIYNQVETALQIAIDRSSAELLSTNDSHVLKIHFRYSTLDGTIINHEFSRKFSK